MHRLSSLVGTYFILIVLSSSQTYGSPERISTAPLGHTSLFSTPVEARICSDQALAGAKVVTTTVSGQTKTVDLNAHLRYATHPEQNFGIVRFGDRTHIAYLDSELRALIRTFDHKVGDWTGPSTFLGRNTQEQHYPNLAVDRDGFIHVVWGGHGGPIPLRYCISKRPNDSSEWRTIEEPFSDFSASYPKIIVDGANYVYLFFRVSPPRATFPEGPWSITYIRKRVGDAAWEAPVVLVSDSQANMPNAVSVQTISGRAAVAWVWNNRTETSPTKNMRNISVAFKSEAGWTRTNGNLYSLPISFSTAEHVYSGYVFRAGSLVQHSEGPLLFFTSTEPLQAVFARYRVGSWTYLTIPNLYIGQFGVDTKGRVHGVVLGKDMVGLTYLRTGADPSSWEVISISPNQVRYPVVAPRLEDLLEATWPEGGRLEYLRVPLTTTVAKCIIVTATYGSELTPAVRSLRDFRDRLILSTFAGRSFISVFNAWYYSFSPSAATFISNNPLARAIMQAALYPLVTMLHLSLQAYSTFSSKPELATIMTGLLACSLIGLVYFFPPMIILASIVARRRRRVFQNIEENSIWTENWN